jgi:conjugative transfer pilus assembly protein TraH
MLLKKVTAVVTATAFTISAHAMNMQELFDSVNSQGNVSNPAVLQGQTMNLYTGEFVHANAKAYLPVGYRDSA